jgi:hypothetical protein
VESQAVSRHRPGRPQISSAGADPPCAETSTGRPGRTRGHPRAVEDLLDRTWGHHGWGRLRRATALYAPPPFTRSEFERHFLAALLSAGLPRPATNFVEAGFELDVYWPEQRFAVELDTYATHGTKAAFERDRLRHEDLMDVGIGMTRVTDVRFAREPDAVLARVARFLARGAA